MNKNTLAVAVAASLSLIAGCNPSATVCLSGSCISTDRNWYADTDGDNYGDPAVSVRQTPQPIGYVLNNTDCDDTDASINPGATEIPDGIDNNCNGYIDVSPWYADSDGDGFGDPGALIASDTQPAGYIADNTDCDDSNALINPDAQEVSDSLDNNCDGTVDELTVGGTVSGLVGNVVLLLNGVEPLTLSNNGPYSFAPILESSTTYDVTITTQPDGYTCLLSNASGTISTTVSNVDVNCTVHVP